MSEIVIIPTPPPDPAEPPKKKPKPSRPGPEPKPFRVKHDLVGPFVKGDLVSEMDLFGPNPKLDVDAAIDRLFDLEAIEEV
jgi:hypothetical protein